METEFLASSVQDVEALETNMENISVEQDNVIALSEMFNHSLAPLTVDENITVLYCLMRSDMASLNAGKAIAQGMHAQSHAHKSIFEDLKYGEYWKSVYDKWRKTTQQGFGTVLVLDVGGLDQLRWYVGMAQKMNYPAEVTHDDSYPILDGSFVHHLPQDTCGWILGNKKGLSAILATLSLYP